MSTPNVVNVTTINGNTAVAAVTTSNTTMVFNAVGSNQLFKVNALYIANANANSNTAIVSAYMTRGGSNFYLASNIVVSANANTIRGQHAHFKCTQFLTCTNGVVVVHCDDGLNKKTFTLDISSCFAKLLEINFHLGNLNSVSHILITNIFDIFICDL